MAYEMTFQSGLRKDRDDAARAKAFDDAYELFSEPQKAYCCRALTKLMGLPGMGEQAAKAFLANTLLFANMKPDEQERWIAHGRAIQADYEWCMALRAKKREMQEAAK